MTSLPRRQVRAEYDDRTITVYQAYDDAIADAALAAGRFVPPFRRGRMTWIKPSFLWMMYRSGWATKPGQTRVLAIRITRRGFEEALAESCLAHYDSTVHADHEQWLARKHATSVRVQWDPERTVLGDPLEWRSLQVGLGGDSVDRYVHEWIVDLTDLTTDVVRWRADPSGAELPRERPYPLPTRVATTVGASPAED